MRSLYLLLAVTTVSLPTVALGDRGALSLEAGGVLSAARVPPGVGTGESVFGTLGGATLGVIVGNSVARWDRKPSRKPIPEKLKVTLGPATALDGSGLGIGVNVVF